MKRRILSLIAVGAIGLSVSACTSAQEQSVLDAINSTCVALPVGASLVIDVASSITGATTVVNLANTVAATGAKACTDLIAGIQSVISSINGGGGTATVTVKTSANGAVTLHALAKQMRAAYPQGHVKASGNTITFVVPPARFPF